MHYFLSDTMLGKLARWLRIAGQDVELAPKNISDDEILEKAVSENRVVLTRDKELSERKENVLLVPDDLKDQLRLIGKEFDIDWSIKPRRCSLCNGKLEETTKGLPEGVENGWRCLDCGQKYWKGSHWKKIRKVFKEVP